MKYFIYLCTTIFITYSDDFYCIFIFDLTLANYGSKFIYFICHVIYFYAIYISWKQVLIHLKYDMLINFYKNHI